MTVALASMLVLMAAQTRTGLLADYESCPALSGAANAQAMIGAEMMVHSVHVVVAENAQAMIGEEMMVHVVQVDEFPTLSRAELHQ
jgi:hypothetical protein